MVPRHACLAACNLPPALLTEKLESFTCHCSNTRCWGGVGGLERIPKEQSAQKADHGEDNSPVDPSRTRTRDISVTSPALEPLSYIYIYVYISSILHTQILDVLRSKRPFWTSPASAGRQMHRGVFLAQWVLCHTTIFQRPLACLQDCPKWSFKGGWAVWD